MSRDFNKYLNKYLNNYCLGMVSPADRELTVIEKIICCIHRTSEKGACLRPLGGTPGLVRGQREKGKHGFSFCGFHRKVRERQGEQT